MLHLTDLEIGGDRDASSLGEGAAAGLAHIAHCLRVDGGALAPALTQRTVSIAGDSMVKPLSTEQAEATRDSAARLLYAKLFDWIVERVSAAVRPPAVAEAGGSHRDLAALGDERFRYIGVLDMFGFEAFETNGFEQLCINYANEKLQQLFADHVFKSVQQEYADEGLDWSAVAFPDNGACVALIEGKAGILGRLDEELRLPHGSDGGFARALIEAFGDGRHESSATVPLSLSEDLSVLI